MEGYIVPAATSGAAPATADCQRVESVTIDAALLATLQKSGLTAKASDGSRILAIRLALTAADCSTGIAPIPTALQPTSSTYDLLGRKSHSAHGITISQGRKSFQ